MGSIASSKTKQPWRITAPSSDSREGRWMHIQDAEGSAVRPQVSREDMDMEQVLRAWREVEGKLWSKGMGRSLQRTLSGSDCCRHVRAGGFFFLVWRSEKSGFDLSWVPGSCWVIWSLFMVLFISHHCFQSICVPNGCSWKKRNSREGGVWNNGGGGCGLHAVFSCETAKSGKRWELGRGRTQSSESMCGDQLLDTNAGQRMLQVPSRSSSQARFQEEPISPSCFLSRLCCPVQVCGRCCFLWTWPLLTVICSSTGGSHWNWDQFSGCLSQLLCQHSLALPGGAQLSPASKTSSLEQQPSAIWDPCLLSCSGKALSSSQHLYLQLWKKEG